jgi:hypothetical protein
MKKCFLASAFPVFGTDHSPPNHQTTMKKLIFSFAFTAMAIFANAQCTTTNATGCACKDTSQTDCDLLPDIQLGHPPFYLYGDTYGVIEYSQTGNPDTADNGRLYVTVSTPNPGHGPLEIFTVDTFICGIDTFYNTPPSICPDGITYPRILMHQRIYHKSGNIMTSYTRPAGTMTYHPTHNHMHVDNWGNYTLRTRDTLQPDPLLWPIVGAGTKLAFCVMDYGTCAGYPDHCLDTAGASLNNNSDFPNYGLGGGSYSCSPVVQGISSGYVDIYWTSLEGMHLEIPPNTCNGEYYIVCEVDPNNNFLEEDETNNVYAAPYIVRKQLPNPAINTMNVSIAGSKMNLCQGESVSLSVQSTMPNVSYLWNNGDTTQFTTANTTGNYSVLITNQCGTGTSLTVPVTVYNPPASPAGTNDTIPVPGTASLSAASSLPVVWYDQPTGGTPLDTGNVFVTPAINTTTTFYAEVEEVHTGASYNAGPATNTSAGQGGYSGTNQSLIFDCYNTFILHQVTVYSQAAGNITIELRDSGNTLIHSIPAALVSGANVLTIDLTINPGMNYRITRTGDDLYRNNPNSGNLGYPFTVQNFLSITGTTAGEGYYYFFYDWKIKLPDNSCTSPRTPVYAVVANPNAIADVAILHSLNIYPNPAKNNVIVSFRSKDQNAKIELIDELGRVVYVRNVSSMNGEFNESITLPELSSGIYNIHILSSGKNIYKRLTIN